MALSIPVSFSALEGAKSTSLRTINVKKQKQEQNQNQTTSNKQTENKYITATLIKHMQLQQR